MIIIFLKKQIKVPTTRERRYITDTSLLENLQSMTSAGMYA